MNDAKLVSDFLKLHVKTEDYTILEIRSLLDELQANERSGTNYEEELGLCGYCGHKLGPNL